MNKRWLSRVVLISFINVAAACSDKESGTDPNTEGQNPGDTAVNYMDLPVALCGMDPYELIDPATLGKIVGQEDNPVVDMPADTLGDILSAGGLNMSPLHESMDSIDKIYNPDHVTAVLESGTESIEHWNCLVREN